MAFSHVIEQPNYITGYLMLFLLCHIQISPYHRVQSDPGKPGKPGKVPILRKLRENLENSGKKIENWNDSGKTQGIFLTGINYIY